MPRTKLQSVIFTAMMVFCMVFCMTCYTIAKKMGGLSYEVFLMAIKEMWIEYVIVFLLIFFLITPVAKKLVLHHFRPGEVNPIFMISSIQCCTVCLIVPSITLIATFLHNGFTAEWFTQWISLAFTCFPCALCLQLFFVGPFVRMLFRTVFRKQLMKEIEE